MKIETKYSIGDLVYYLSHNAIAYKPIDFIRIEINESGNIETKYCIRATYAECEWRTEDKLFTSKEELLKSL